MVRGRKQHQLLIRSNWPTQNHQMNGERFVIVMVFFTTDTIQTKWYNQNSLLLTIVSTLSSYSFSILLLNRLINSFVLLESLFDCRFISFYCCAFFVHSSSFPLDLPASMSRESACRQSFFLPATLPSTVQLLVSPTNQKMGRFNAFNVFMQWKTCIIHNINIYNRVTYPCLMSKIRRNWRKKKGNDTGSAHLIQKYGSLQKRNEWEMGCG